jgi:hypothetical protein
MERQENSNPLLIKRQKLANKISEQIQLAKATLSGKKFKPVKVRKITDLETGEQRDVEVPKRLKPWWWPNEQGKICITVRYGARVLEVIEGKNSIEVENLAAVITALEVLRAAVEQGELDERINVISKLVNAGFRRDLS